MKPPAPKPVSGLSAAKEASTAQTAASTALPPSRSTPAPASAVSGWPAATTPGIGRLSGSAWENLRDVDAQLFGAPRAPAAGILRPDDGRLDRAPRRRRVAVETGGDHRHPDLIAEGLVDIGSEDDV